MRIRLGQLNVTIGDLEGNFSLIEEAISAAEADDIDLLVLPELVVCGYSPMDLLERSDFLNAVYRFNNRIVKLTEKTAVLFGTLTPNEKEVGRKCYNAAILAYEKNILNQVHKALLPTYDVYDELRYFEPDKRFECVEFGGRKLGITICEDIWHNYQSRYLNYKINPVEELVERGAEAIVNISASPYSRKKPAKRKGMLQEHAQKWRIPIFYANQVGGNTELLSDGDSMVVDRGANVVARAPLFEEAFADVAWEPGKDTLETVHSASTDTPPEIEQMFRGLVMGLRDYLRKTGVADKVVLGLSGGIDSALAAVIAVEALGTDKVTGFTMPSEFSSEGSVSDSRELAENLQISCHTMAVKEIYGQFRETLRPFFEDTTFGVAEENLQPRIRGTLLMAYSNKFGHMLLNTGNKSELATGYCTLYGDMAGGLAIIGDLYKIEVYEMARWLNNDYFEKEVIPERILNKAPSAELRPGQKDADSLPGYDVLDPILKAYIEEQLSIDKIVNRGYDSEVVRRVIAMVDRMEYKRYQAAPALKVSEKAFGTGRRLPMVQKWTNNRAND